MKQGFSLNITADQVPPHLRGKAAAAIAEIDAINKESIERRDEILETVKARCGPMMVVAVDTSIDAFNRLNSLLTLVERLSAGRDLDTSVLWQSAEEWHRSLQSVVMAMASTIDKVPPTEANGLVKLVNSAMNSDVKTMRRCYEIAERLQAEANASRGFGGGSAH